MVDKYQLSKSFLSAISVKRKWGSSASQTNFSEHFNDMNEVSFVIVGNQ